MRRVLCAVAMALALQSAAAVEINQANEAELDSVKGLGPASTARILKERAKGDFKSWADFLARVKGFKASTATKLSDNGLTVNGARFDPAVETPSPQR